MLQVVSWVRLRCDQCAEILMSRTGDTGHPSAHAAHTEATAAGWRDDPGGRWWCSACAVVLACQDWGHEFTEWRRALAPGGFYRYCQRCCLHERCAPGEHPLTVSQDLDEGDLDGGVAVGEVA